MVLVDKKILTILKNKGEKGANITEIAKKLNLDRHTASKHLELMHSKKLVASKIKGKAKIWKLTNSPILEAFKQKDIVSERLRQILNNLDTHVSIQTKDYKIIWSNKSAKKINASLKCHEAYAGLNHACSHCPAEQVFKTGKEQSTTITLNEKTGAKAEIIMQPLFDQHNKPIGIIEIIKKK